MIFMLFLLVLACLVVAVILQCLPSSVRALLPNTNEDAVLPPAYPLGVVVILLAFNAFQYDNTVIAIGTGLFVAFVCLALVATLPARKRTFFAAMCTIIGCAAGCALSFRANEFVQAVNAATAACSVGALLLLHAVDHIEWNAAWLLRTVLLYPAVVFRRIPGVLSLVKPSKLSGLSRAVRVIGITAVLVIFFAAILSGADPIFAEKIRMLHEQVIPRTVWSVVIACIFLVAVAAAYVRSYTYKALPLSFLSWVETAVPVGAVCVLFGMFLWVQATYLFADHASFKELNLTYAEYVRKGMIEVLIATFCAGLLSYVVSLKERELTGMREVSVLRAVNMVLVLELFLMLASAMRRDWLYMEAYGLSRVRIVGEVFLAWLAVIILLIAVFALWRRLQEKAVFAGAIAASFCVVVYLNAFNMDAKIASAMPPQGQRIDTYYLSLLSVDAVDGWGSAINDMALEFEDIRTKRDLSAEDRSLLASIALSAQNLRSKREAVLSDASVRDWRSWRRADAVAVAAMSGSTVFGDTLDCLTREIADYRTIHRMELADESSALAYGYRRPFVARTDWYDDFPYLAAYTSETADSCVQ